MQYWVVWLVRPVMPLSRWHGMPTSRVTFLTTMSIAELWWVGGPFYQVNDAPVPHFPAPATIGYNDATDAAACGGLSAVYVVTSVDLQGEESGFSNEHTVTTGGPTTTTTTTTTTTSSTSSTTTTTTTSSTSSTTTTTTTTTSSTSSTSTSSTSSTSTSSTSSTTSTTLEPGLDTDDDGIDDNTENLAPNGGDGNLDGTIDSQQGHVTSLPNALDGKYVTLAVSSANELINVGAVGNLTPPEPVDFPIGFFDFTTDADTVEITIPAGVVVNSWWKFGPTPGDPTDHFYQFPEFDGTLGAEILANQNKIILHFVDGQLGDDDLQVNGQITDPGGPGFAIPAVVPAALEGGNSQTQSALSSTAAFEDIFVGLAVVDASGSENAISLSVVDSAGNAVETIDLQQALGRGPLGGRGQTTFLTRDVLTSVSNSVALFARGQQGPIQSFFLIGDNGQTRLDGLAGEFQASERLYFPSVREGAGETTLLFVFNPGNQTASEVQFSLYNPQGQLIRETQRTIAPNGFVLETVEELFRGIGELVVLEGYVEVDAGVPLTGFEFLEGLQSFYALSAQVARKRRVVCWLLSSLPTPTGERRRSGSSTWKAPKRTLPR